jgi:hypothetical protein
MSLLKSKNLISFNFIGNMLKLIEARPNGNKLELVGVSACNLEGLSHDDAVKAVRECTKDFKLKDCSAIVSVDSQSVITKNIEIPSVDESEIREIIDLQAGRYTPYAREEILIDYINIDTYHNSYTKVLIVILVQETIKKHLAIVEEVGFKVSKVLFAPEVFSAACSRALGLSSKNTASAALNIDTKSSDFIILYKGKTVFVRNIPLGYENFDKDRESFGPVILEEVKKSIEAYRAEEIAGLPLDMVVIAPRDLFEAIKPALGQNLNLPVRQVSFEGFVSTSPTATSAMSRTPGVSFANAIASFIAAQDSRIDLRPSELKMRIAFEEKSHEMIKSGALVMALTVLVCSLMGLKIYYKGQYLKRVEKELAVTEPQVESLNKASTRVRVVKNYLDYKQHSLEVLSELYTLVPEDIYLKNLSIDENGNVSIRGTAEVMSEVFAFVTALENSKMFENASAKNTTNRKEEGKDVSEFEITCVIKKGK